MTHATARAELARREEIRRADALAALNPPPLAPRLAPPMLAAVAAFTVMVHRERPAERTAHVVIDGVSFDITLAESARLAHLVVAGSGPLAGF